MTDKKLKVNSAAYTELSIQIAVLQASVDKLLELAIKNQQNQFTVINPTIQGESRVYQIPEDWKNTDAFCGSLGSDDEKFLEDFK